MACLAGTKENPRPWIRMVAGEPVRLQGRHCDRTKARTSRAMCSSCPAYRGVRYDGSVATGLAPNGAPIGLRPDEHEAYEEALNAAFIDDDFTLIGAWEARMTDGIGDRTLRDIGDPDATARWADYMRDYRGRNAAYVERNREQTRARMRARRAVCK